MSDPSPLLKVMIAAAEAAGASLAADFAALSELEIIRKGPADFVSAADLKAEEILRDRLAQAYPRYGFLGEEGGHSAGEDAAATFIADPLDGTTNFLCGNPLFGVNLALERDGELAAAVTLNPVLGEVYWAEKGCGAYLNGRRIQVSERPRLADAVLSVGIPFPGKDGHGLFAREMQALSARAGGLRRLGSAAMDMAYVAAGRFDGFWERQLNPWDLAPGALLIVEAGGRATAADGGPLDLHGGSVCATNGRFHEELLAQLAAAADKETLECA